MSDHRQQIDIDRLDLKERFILSTGPGGQNVNKVATAVELRVSIASIPWLNEKATAKLRKIAGKRISSDDELIIVAKRYRSQERNRQDARDRLKSLLEQALQKEKSRKKTRIPPSVKRKRLDSKKRHGEKKRLRGKPPVD